jgi:hypothetical protein
MQAQAVEGEAAQEFDGVQRIAASRVGLANPIADRPALGDAAQDVAQRDAAEELIVVLPQGEEGVAQA